MVSRILHILLISSCKHSISIKLCEASWTDSIRTTYTRRNHKATLDVLALGTNSFIDSVCASNWFTFPILLIPSLRLCFRPTFCFNSFSFHGRCVTFTIELKKRYHTLISVNVNIINNTNNLISQRIMWVGILRKIFILQSMEVTDLCIIKL